MTAAQGQRRGSVVLVTRPGEPGQRLTGALRGRGQRALWWPAFDLLPPTQVEPLQAQLQRLPEFDLVVFVSAAAVRGLARLQVCVNWPAATRIAAVGASTLQLAHSLLPGAAAARSAGIGLAGLPAKARSPSEARRAKEGSAKEGAAGARSPAFALRATAGEPDSAAGAAAPAAKSGSEGLWQALQKEPERPRRVMIVRAEAGREWLGDRLREVGCYVEYAAVYRREVHQPSAEQRGALAASCSVGDRPATVLTSSEAVVTLDRQLSEAPEIKAWLRRGRALCSHPRIVQAALAGGYGEARECEPSAAAVLDAIDGAGHGDTAPVLAEARAP